MGIMNPLRIILGYSLLAISLLAGAQSKTPTNRYAMKLEQDADGKYSLLQQAKYDKQLDIDVIKIPDVLVPYTHTPDKLSSKAYKGVSSKEYVYKTANGRELKLTVDYSVNEDSKSPFVIYIHGGGWSKGNMNSQRTLSHHMAKQHGVTGIRVEYSLAGQPGADINVAVQDISDALKFINENADVLNVDPQNFAFAGTSAGAHLAAVAAMKEAGCKAFVGYSGIYDLTSARIVQKTKDANRIAFFLDRNQKVLEDNSPIYLIPKKDIPASLLIAGTCDVTVESKQSRNFAKALKSKGADVELKEYKYYDHNLASKSSDRMEEIFFLTTDFLKNKLGLDRNPDKSSSEITQVATVKSVPYDNSAERELNAIGIHAECPDSSGAHKNNPVAHIVKVMDKDLGKNVYAFHIHAAIDDDRGGKKFKDRQRNEIKTDSKSPIELWAKEDETMTFKWKMKLPRGMKTTNRFTHIHQLKGIDNKEGTALVGRPLLCFTCASSSKGKQEFRLRYYDRRKGDNVPETLAKINLLDLMGRWVNIEETVKFAENGSYTLRITDVKTGKVILEYDNDNLDMWRTDALGLRPKWGIYRYLGENRELLSDLRDEELRFADFEIIKH